MAKDGDILFSKSYGFSDIGQKTMNTVDTRFMIGSLTKQFTGVAVMQLVEKGLIKVEDKIDKYAVGFQEGNKITIHHLLTHTSGLPRDLKLDSDKPVPTKMEEAFDLAKSSSISFLFAPGESFSYSNFGYGILGYIIEKVSGESYTDYVDKNILKPLKMTNSGFGYDVRSNKPLSLSYNLNKEPVVKEQFVDLTINNSVIGMYSTVGDMYKWDRALYKYDLVSKKSMDRIFDGGKFGYGYGWGIVSENGKRIYRHAGEILGYKSYISRMVDDDVFIVILSNVNDGATDYFNLDNLIKEVLKQ